MLELTEKEKKMLRKFFEQTAGWISKNSLKNYQNLLKLVDIYGHFLEENGLNNNRALQMFLIKIKQEAEKARLKRKPLRPTNIRVYEVAGKNTWSDNPVINAWNIACQKPVQHNINEKKFDYDEYAERILEGRLRARSKIKQQQHLYKTYKKIYGQD